MPADLIRLHPAPGEAVPHRGLYLERPMVPAGHTGLFVYTNFVASLDGRIAVVDPHSGRETIPRTIANRRDWRLFQELAAHADVLITSGRYLREFAAGTAQDVLPVSGAEAFTHIREWRERHARSPQPDVAVLSASLSFTVPHLLLEQGRRVRIFTTPDAPPELAAEREAEGAEVVRLGDDPVSGHALVDHLAALGYRTAYCIAGPYVLHTLAAAQHLHALFLTTVHRLVGGERYATLLQGQPLAVGPEFQLTSLYLDPAGAQGAPQQFARYDR